MSRVPRLLIVSHVLHYSYNGRLFAFGPYAREIDIWADLFPNVTIAAPCRAESPPPDCLPFTRANISMRPQLETGGTSLLAKTRQIVLLPALIAGLIRAMSSADAIHVRCPGNLGLLGILLARFFSRYRVAKYAGQWNDHDGEAATSRLQRWLLKSRLWGSPVTVYGEFASQPSHVIPFFTSIMTREQVDQSEIIADRKRIELPLRVLFSGRLVPEKRVEVLLNAIKIALSEGAEIELSIVGDGPHLTSIKHRAAELGIQDFVTFVGTLPFNDALRWYEWAHCLVLPSNSEGWPKVVAEAMCHGVICVAMDCGHVSSMLQNRGIVLQEGTADEIAHALIAIVKNPCKYRQLAHQASRWARQFSLEGLRDALARLFRKHWKIDFQTSDESQRCDEIEASAPCLI